MARHIEKTSSTIRRAPNFRTLCYLIARIKDKDMLTKDTLKTQKCPFAHKLQCHSKHSILSEVEVAAEVVVEVVWHTASLHTILFSKVAILLQSPGSLKLIAKGIGNDGKLNQASRPLLNLTLKHVWNQSLFPKLSMAFQNSEGPWTAPWLTPYICTKGCYTTEVHCKKKVAGDK